MKEFALQNPFLAFMLVIAFMFLVGSIVESVSKAISAFGTCCDDDYNDYEDEGEEH